MFRLALRNVKRAWRDYTSYFLSLASIATVFYLFIGLRYNRFIATAIESRSELSAAGIVSGVVILLVGFDFAWYSSDFFLRSRYREMGLYNLYGLRKTTIGGMMILEHLLLGAAALILGVVLGFMLSKLFVMAVLRIMGLSMPIGLSFEPEAVRDTALCFALLLAPVSLRSGRTLRRYELAWLFKAERAAQEDPQERPWLGFIAVAALLLGYGLALSSSIRTVIVNFFVVAAVTILSTWGIVRTFLPWVVGKLRNARALSWRGGRLIAWAELGHRIRSNVKLFVNVAITGSAAMIALGFGFNALALTENTSGKARPWDISFESERPEAELDARVRAAIADRGLSIVDSSFTEAIAVQAVDNSFAGLRERSLLGVGEGPVRVVAVKTDAREPTTAAEGVGSATPFLEPPHVGIRPTTNHRRLDFSDGESLELGSPPTDAPLNLHPESAFYVVFVDAETFGRLAALPEVRPLISYDYRVSDREALRELAGDLKSILAGHEFYCYEELAKDIRRFRLYLFLGFLAALVFLGSSCSVLFFKEMAETQADRERFRILLDMGAPPAALSRVIALQTLPLFVVPLALAMLHSLVALVTMGIVLGDNFALPIAVTLASYAAIFLGLGAFTTRRYRRAVLGSSALGF